MCLSFADSRSFFKVSKCFAVLLNSLAFCWCKCFSTKNLEGGGGFLCEIGAGGFLLLERYGDFGLAVEIRKFWSEADDNLILWTVEDWRLFLTNDLEGGGGLVETDLEGFGGGGGGFEEKDWGTDEEVEELMILLRVMMLDLIFCFAIVAGDKMEEDFVVRLEYDLMASWYLWLKENNNTQKEIKKYHENLY